jgi:hypothetical protein
MSPVANAAATAPAGRSSRGGPARPARVLLPFLATLALAAHLYGLYRVGGPPGSALFPQDDKVAHVVGFAVPVALLLMTRLVWSGAGKHDRRWVAGLVLGFAVHAVVSELVQHTYYTWRDGDPLDTVADLVGTGLGWAAYQLIRTRLLRGPGGRTQLQGRP